MKNAGFNILDWVSAMMIVSEEQAEGAIVSSTPKNGGGEKTAPVGVAVKHRQGDFCWDQIRIIGQGNGKDSSVMMGNGCHHHLQDPQKWG